MRRTSLDSTHEADHVSPNSPLKKPLDFWRNSNRFYKATLVSTQRGTSPRRAVLSQPLPDAEPSPDQVQALCDDVLAKDLLPLLAENMRSLDFEVRGGNLSVEV